jgi:hypothetical protein
VSSQPARKIARNEIVYETCNKVVNVCANVMYNKYEGCSLYCVHSKK